MKKYAILFFVLSSSMVFAQTYYEIGQVTVALPGKPKMTHFSAAEITVTSDRRTWKSIECLPKEKGDPNKCYSYKVILSRDLSGKMTLDQPVTMEKRIQCPAKVEEDHIKLRSLTCRYETEKDTHTYVFRQLEKTSMWKYRLNRNGSPEAEETTAVMESVDSKTYQEALKGKNITPLNI